MGAAIRSINMNNDKRNVHRSGALGMLLQSGQIKNIDEEELKETNITAKKEKISSEKFVTDTGLVFTEDELFYIDPEHCESWKYANRLPTELGDIDELIKSIKEQGQLQPALVRSHPNSHGNVKFEIIFGRRRHIACMHLNRPLLVIKKDFDDLKEAVAYQDAENKQRKNISNYSNSSLYKRLLEDKVFLSEKELAEKLGFSPSTFSNLMSFSKIPVPIISVIPDIHNLPISMAAKILSLLNASKSNYQRLVSIAPQIGNSITTPAKLEKMMEPEVLLNERINDKAKVIKSKNGKKLFTFKTDYKGTPCVLIDREIANSLSMDNLCEHLKVYLEQEIQSLEKV